MATRKKNSGWLGSVILSASVLMGCASSSPPPLVTPREIVLTPLPASVTEIDLQNSVTWQEKALNWLQKLDTFSKPAASK